MNFFKEFDWTTVVIYLILVVIGWFTINAASYSFDDVSIFDFARVSGKQAVWFGLSLLLIVVILCLDSSTYKGYAPFVYIGIMLLLLATIKLGTEINGSHSWIKIGSFSIQPAEFGKFSTALMLAYLFATPNYHFTRPSHFFLACIICMLPVALIILQNETGSALVYFSFVFLFYRKGMSGVVLWLGFCLILIFVLGVKYSVVPLSPGEVLKAGETLLPSRFGENLVLLIIPYLVSLMTLFWVESKRDAFHIAIFATIVYIGFEILKRVIELPFPIYFRWVGWTVCAYTSLRCIWAWLVDKNLSRMILVGLCTVMFVGFQYCVDYAFHDVLQKHQRGRIEVLLGMTEDLKGAGYNVNQAKIAIGSGGFFGKGYLQGTQTKLAYVPEQETDFIFCTIGEEQGFFGSSIVLLLFLTLIARLIFLAERHAEDQFTQVYGYCVACIFIFHLLINVGMVIGLVPVIGIPLPFFSYGGSSLWSFTILLFIFLKLDADGRKR